MMLERCPFVSTIRTALTGTGGLVYHGYRGLPFASLPPLPSSLDCEHMMSHCKTRFRRLPGSNVLRESIIPGGSSLSPSSIRQRVHIASESAWHCFIAHSIESPRGETNGNSMDRASNAP